MKQAHVEVYTGRRRLVIGIGLLLVMAAGVSIYCLLFRDRQSWPLDSTVGKANLAKDYLLKAQQKSEAITNPAAKVFVSWNVAKAQAQAGDIPAAWAAFSQALHTAQNIQQDGPRDFALRTIAIALIDTGKVTGERSFIEHTRQLALANKDPNEKAFMLVQVAAAQAQLKDETAGNTFELARQAAEAIADPRFRGDALARVAAMKAQIGSRTCDRTLFDQAQQIALTIADPFEKDRALLAIATAQPQLGVRTGQRGFIEQAQQTARTVSGPSINNSMLLVVATAQARVGDKEALNSFNEAKLAAQAITDDRGRAGAIRGIASALAKAAAHTGDRQYLGLAKQLAQTSADSKENITLLRALIAGQTKVATKTGEHSLFVEAQQTAQAISDPYIRASAQADIALAQATDKTASSKTFAQAQQSAQAIPDAFHKAEALRSIAAAQAQAGARTGERRFFDEARRTANTITDPIARAAAVQSIAAALAQANLLAEVQALIQSESEPFALASIYLGAAEGLLGISNEEVD